MKKQIDLHLHSTCSDGTFSPQEVVHRASMAGISAISLTDHDSTEGIAAALEKGQQVGVEVVPGVELSASENGKDFHILGYFIDHGNTDLMDCLRKFREARKARAVKIVEKLNRIGIQIRIEQVMAKAGGGSVGRPHVADVLVEKGFAFSTNEAFQKYLGYSKPAYQSKHSISPAQAFQVIHVAGGIACLAHPGLYSRDDLIPKMVRDGLDGIEVVHIKHRAADRDRYKKIASCYGLLQTGGSDCHGNLRGGLVMGQVDVPRIFLDKLRAAHNRIAKSGLKESFKKIG